MCFFSDCSGSLQNKGGRLSLGLCFIDAFFALFSRPVMRPYKLSPNRLNAPVSPLSYDIAYRIGIMSVEMQRLFLSMTMNVIGGNVDDHNKNFSFMMGQDGVWHIIPT